MFCAKLASPLKAVANASVAPGARSYMISSIAVPSSPDPAWPGRTCTFGGRSPDACTAARESTPSDSTQTFTPFPLTPKLERASAA